MAKNRGLDKNPLIIEIRALVKMLEQQNANPLQIKYYRRLLQIAKPVKCVRAADVLDDYQLDYIKHVLKPQPKHCYRNAHLLCEAFPEITYVEGKAGVPFEIDHAFNKIGDKYFDITFEFALDENPREYPYLSIAEFDADQIEQMLQETGFYGEYYQYQQRKETAQQMGMNE